LVDRTNRIFRHIDIRLIITTRHSAAQWIARGDTMGKKLGSLKILCCLLHTFASKATVVVFERELGIDRYPATLRDAITSTCSRGIT
jgi:hypothetical protein